MKRLIKGECTLDDLSNREMEVFEWLCIGLKPTRIAHNMNLSIKTVSTYRKRLSRKLGIPLGIGRENQEANWKGLLALRPKEPEPTPDTLPSKSEH